MFRDIDGAASVVVTEGNRVLSDDGLILTLLAVSDADNGTYWIEAVNDAGMVTSPATTVEVFGMFPVELIAY